MEEFMLPRKDLLQIGLYTILICSLLSGSDGTLSIFVLQLAQHDTPMHQWNLPSLPKEFVWHPSSTINDCDLSAAFILGWHFYMGSDYLKSNLYLANNSMVTGHFNLKKTQTCFSACLRVLFISFQNSQFYVRTGTLKKICLVHLKYPTVTEVLIT